MTEFFAGQQHRAQYPFVRTTYDALPDDADGVPQERPTWRPGVEHENLSQYSEWTYADGMGAVEYVVIGVFKPGSYPARVFYTRTWVDPDGKRFGNQKLRITTMQNFRTLIKGYRHDYEMKQQEAA